MDTTSAERASAARGPSSVPRVQTCLWFDGRIDEAAEFYVSLLPDSRILGRTEYAETDAYPGAQDLTGQALTVQIELSGVPYTLLNGGPHFRLSEAVSVVVDVDTQAEVDRLWSAIVDGGGEESQCGWCRDRFGLSWQIVPRRLYELLEGPHGAAVTEVMLTQRRLDLAALEAAAH
ncbi:MAG: VOC family protein [Nesterenkonia sp.]|uniref:VOC family protein n=1 Tax=Nesterenkonia marinintestina TaxID=2979865 RepID=UPI0021BDFA03|nr:VOC family protein [Nesterenkonia sp. GX14115]MDO5493150.1 VOC family protein [Nesterenkonia sp.]